MQRVVVFALLVLAVVPPFARASSASPVSVVGPDADGAFALSFNVTRDGAGSAALALDVSRDDGSSVARSSRDLGAADLPAGSSPFNVSFLPSDGAGSYAVALVVDGAASEPLRFDVTGDGGSQVLQFQVPDEPTWLNLTNDSVNADGKLKSPGEDVVTRALLSDGNGVGDLDAVAFVVQHDAWLDAGSVLVNASPTNTSAALELRYARSPLAAGNYSLSLRALKGGAVVASAQRSFVIRDVAPTMLNASLASVIPDAPSSQTTDVVLLDKNGPAPAPDLRVYKGSSRVEGAGFRATLGAARALPDADGAARVLYPLLLEAPANASAGSYRVSVYENGSLVGAIPFDVSPLPTLASLVASPSSASLSLALNLTAPGVVRAVVTDGAGATLQTTLALPAGMSNVTLDAPDRAPALRWSLSLAARADGPVLDQRNGSWLRDLPSPTLRVAPLHVGARLPAVWSLDAAGWDLAGATANVTVLRWDGAPAPVSASYHEGVVRVEGPATLESGRYSVRVDLALPNGTPANASWSFDAAPWLRLSLGAPVVTQREARIPLANAGGVAVGRVVVESDAGGNVTLELGGRVLTASAGAAPGRWVFAGAGLAPGANATLVVRLPEGPQRAGAHAASVRVLALAEATRA